MQTATPNAATTAGADPRARETERLIGSDKVEGTAVRRPNGDKVGTIHRIMLDKRSGRVAYAVMSFGGFLGMGKDYYALPWSKLTYNERLDAYELDITEDQLRGAPVYHNDDDWQDPDFGRRTHDYYGVTPYWM